MRIFWTDGSAAPNPGPGGYAVLENGAPAALGREANSTNIRMEGCAILAAINLAGDDPCEIHTDSEFWVNVLTKWAPGWAAKNWKKKTGEIKNLGLVQAVYFAYSAKEVHLEWVRGHNGTELNELADEWANRAREGEAPEGVENRLITEADFPVLVQPGATSDAGAPATALPDQTADLPLFGGEQ